MKEPILFLIFNRPDLTEQVFDSIKQYQPERLYIAADGPRKNNPQDTLLCVQARKIIDKIDWNCQLLKMFRNDNLGCKHSVSTAINWFFDNEERGIIIEDDILPSQQFYIFCETLLEHYNDNNAISMISGDNFSFGKMKKTKHYYYSLYTHIWGWASWRRAWKDYSVTITEEDLAYFMNSMQFLNFSRTEQNYWLKIFKKVISRNIDTWDYQWVLTNFKHRRYSIMPTNNMIRNIGFRRDATHTTNEKSEIASLQHEQIKLPVQMNKEIKYDKKYDFYSRNDINVLTKTLHFIRNSLSK